MAFKPLLRITDNLGPSNIREWLRQAKLHDENKPEGLALFQTIDGLLQAIEQSNKILAANSAAIALINNQSFGLYIPTLTNVANITSSTPAECFYSNIGNIVRVSGALNVEPTVGFTLTQLGISLPISSLLNNSGQCVGIASSPDVMMETIPIIGDATNDRAQMEWTSSFITDEKFYFNFSYRII